MLVRRVSRTAALGYIVGISRSGGRAYTLAPLSSACVRGFVRGRHGAAPLHASPSVASSLLPQESSRRAYFTTSWSLRQHRQPQHPHSQQQQTMASSMSADALSSSSSSTSVASPAVAGSAQAIAVTYTPGSGRGGAGLTVPTTAISAHCDIIAESLSKTDELLLQKRAQESLGAGADILTADGIEEMIEELQEAASNEAALLLRDMRSGHVVQQAGMHELRRTLYYATSLKEKGWIEPQAYTGMMRMLTVELLRRDNDGVLAPDDVLYVTTHMVAANFYNRHLWNRMENALWKFRNFENVDMSIIKALTTKLFKTRRGCPKETLDIRRKILMAMSRRVSVLANDFDLPSLLGILQCYSVHDMAPTALEPLAIRAMNHVGEFTPQECATLAHVLRKFRLMRLDVCERLVDRVCTADQLNQHMANSILIAIKSCYGRVSDGGRNAIHAEPTRQKLRAMGEQIGSRLDEVEFPALRVVLSVLDTVVSLKIYVPKKALQSTFRQADEMIRVVTERVDNLVDPRTGKEVRPVTIEEGRQLQALLLHYGPDLCPELADRLRNAFREGLLPDEASL